MTNQLTPTQRLAAAYGSAPASPASHIDASLATLHDPAKLTAAENAVRDLEKLGDSRAVARARQTLGYARKAAEAAQRTGK
ncbi:hypothetical protein ACFYE2_05720 [Kocuria sp. CPCC 205300]|uniref:hypothetical protein n=1 Tax=Kocuria sabuli TaxID=3071448 RepID=UPI0036DC8D4C